MTRSRDTANTQLNSGGAVSPTASGVNAIINGAFDINQRAFTSLTSSGYGFDRWYSYISNGTVTVTPQSFTLGAAPVAGYEGKNFYRSVTSGQTLSSAAANMSQAIESVRTFAGQTVTISFFARAGSGTPKIAVEFQQQFGTGGSPSTSVGTYAGQATLSASWARYSMTVAVPSITGKTLGTTDDGALALVLWFSAGSDFNSRTGSLGIQSNTFDVWGVQVEAGIVPTAFKRNAPSIQAELAACQRYYWRWNTTTSYTMSPFIGFSSATNSVQFLAKFPVTMRTNPSSIDIGGNFRWTENRLSYNDMSNGSFALMGSTEVGTKDDAWVLAGPATGTPFTAGRSGLLTSSGNTSTYLGFSAEL